MRDPHDIETVLNDFLPWSHEPTGVTATLAAAGVRDEDDWTGDYFVVGVEFTQPGDDLPTIVGSVKYHYWPATDTMEAVAFNAGAAQGMLLLKDYHDASCSMFLDHGFNGRTKAFDQRVRDVYEDFGWQADPDDPNTYRISPTTEGTQQ